MNFLEDPFISSLVARLDQPGVIGLALVGSYARGENKIHSDVDVELFVDTLPEKTYTLRYIEGRLVSLKYLTVENELLSLARPQAAIWAVPGLSGMQILSDPSGQIEKLKQTAMDFNWKDLQPAANEYAVEELMGCAEEAHKIVSGLAQGNESKVLYAAWGLFNGLTHAVAVQRGLMIDSENRYFDILQNSLGREHVWTRALRLAFGMEYGDINLSAYQARGKAALELYKQTTLLFKDFIDDAHREVIGNTLQLIDGQTA